MQALYPTQAKSNDRIHLPTGARLQRVPIFIYSTIVAFATRFFLYFYQTITHTGIHNKIRQSQSFRVVNSKYKVKPYDRIHH